MFDSLLSNNKENKKLPLPPETPMAFFFNQSINMKILTVMVESRYLLLWFECFISYNKENRNFAAPLAKTIFFKVFGLIWKH